MTNHKVLFAVIALACIFLLYIFLPTGEEGRGTDPRIAEEGQGLSFYLKSYYESTGNYPTNYEEFLNGISDLDPDTKKHYIRDWQYVASSDLKHFVAYITLSRPKEFSNATLIRNSVKGTIQGINCSDPKIYCITDR